MNGLLFRVEGNWGHFKKPETNNNPLTHDFITKPALIGLVGAVLGLEREKMRPLFPQLCDDFLYGVQIIGPIRKESWSFSMRTAVNPTGKAVPKHMEFLRTPKFLIALMLQNQKSERIFSTFRDALKNCETCYTPVLGLHNCPAELTFESDGEFSERRLGPFAAKCFVSRGHQLKEFDGTRPFRLGLDRIPTYQDDNFWNPPNRYREVIFTAEENAIEVEGEFYEYKNGERWWLT